MSGLRVSDAVFQNFPNANYLCYGLELYCCDICRFAAGSYSRFGDLCRNEEYYFYLIITHYEIVSNLYPSISPKEYHYIISRPK